MAIRQAISAQSVLLWRRANYILSCSLKYDITYEYIMLKP